MDRTLTAAVTELEARAAGAVDTVAKPPHPANVARAEALREAAQLLRDLDGQAADRLAADAVPAGPSDLAVKLYDLAGAAAGQEAAAATAGLLLAQASIAGQREAYERAAEMAEHVARHQVTA